MEPAKDLFGAKRRFTRARNALAKFGKG